MKAPQIFRLVPIVFVTLILAGTAQAEGRKPGLIFGIKPGMLVQSSYFGLGYEKWEPFAGLDWVGLKIKTEEADASGSVLIPHLGTKLLLRPRAEKQVVPYFLGDWFFSLADVSIDGYSSAEEELVKDVLEMWGLTLGFGAEYYLGESFSVGGEYGIRYLHNKIPRHETVYDYGSDEYVDTVNEEFSFAFRVTYAVITMNYHF